MKGSISKRTLDALVPETEGDVFLWDRELSRFGVKVTPAGVKTYVVQCGVAHRSRRLTIGRHGQPWTPDVARRRALQLRFSCASAARLRRRR